MKQTIFSQCLTASSRDTIPIYHLISYLRTLFYVLLLFCTAIVKSNSAYAYNIDTSYPVSQIDIDDQYYTDKATIHFDGSLLPKYVHGFKNVRIVKADLHLGGAIYPVSSDQAQVHISVLDTSSWQEAKVHVTYDLSLPFAIAEWGRCLSRYTSWYWWIPSDGFLNCVKPVIQAFRQDQLYKINVRRSLDEEIAKLTSDYKLATRDLVSKFGLKFTVYRPFYVWILHSLMHDYVISEIRVSANSREHNLEDIHYYEYWLGYRPARQKLYHRMFDISTAYNMKIFYEAVLGEIDEQHLSNSNGHLEQVLIAFMDSNCSEKLPQQFGALMPVNNQNELNTIAQDLTDYACQYNENQFTRKLYEVRTSEPVQFNNQGEDDFKPYVFCNKYFCKFKVSRVKSYLLTVLFESVLRDLQNYLSPSIASSERLKSVCSEKTCSIIDSDGLSQYLDQEIQHYDSIGHGEFIKKITTP